MSGVMVELGGFVEMFELRYIVCLVFFFCQVQCSLEMLGLVNFLKGFYFF